MRFDNPKHVAGLLRDHQTATEYPHIMPVMGHHISGVLRGHSTSDPSTQIALRFDYGALGQLTVSVLQLLRMIVDGADPLMGGVHYRHTELSPATISPCYVGAFASR